MRRKIGTVLVCLLMFVFLGVGGYAGYQLYLSHVAYAQGDETYEALLRQVITPADTTETTATLRNTTTSAAQGGTEAQATTDAAQAAGEITASAATAAQTVDVPQRTVDYDALRTISADAVGWLYCPDTVIDYPVMQTTDNSYYLRHLPDGTYNINGSLFLDYQCAADFSDQLSVIYGHNMKSEKMFASLVGYQKQDYYDAHPYLYLYTEARNYRIALLYGAIVSDTQWTEGSFSNNAEALLAYAAANTTFTSAESYTEGQQLVALSTCSYEFDGARYFVVGILQPAT